MVLSFEPGFDMNIARHASPIAKNSALFRFCFLQFIQLYFSPDLLQVESNV